MCALLGHIGAMTSATQPLRPAACLESIACTPMPSLGRGPCLQQHRSARIARWQKVSKQASDRNVCDHTCDLHSPPCNLPTVQRSSTSGCGAYLQCNGYRQCLLMLGCVSAPGATRPLAAFAGGQTDRNLEWGTWKAARNSTDFSGVGSSSLGDRLHT